MSALDSIRDFLALSDRIATAGQPALDQFTIIRSSGFTRVINLIPPDAATYVAEEPHVVTELGMEYVNIPVIWDAPTAENLADFFACMDDCRERKTFIHCVANKRVSAFVFLYRVLRLRADETDAEDDMERIWTPVGVWREFVDTALLSAWTPRPPAAR